MNQLALIPMKNNLVLFRPQAGRRKGARPLSTKHAIHLILKSEKHSLRRNECAIVNLAHKFGTSMGVKIYSLVVNSDHIHAAIRIHSRQAYRKFISALTGLLSARFQIKWKTSPATRIVTWGSAYKRLLKYLKLNEWEAAGFIQYQPDRTRNLPPWLRL